MDRVLSQAPNELNGGYSVLLPFNPHQFVRPSGHSYVILLSHVSFLLCITAAVRKRLLMESVSLLFSGVISICYHVCDENFGCWLNLNIFQWHAADVWSTFFLTCFVLGVIVLDIEDRKMRFVLRFVYFVLVTGFVWYDPGSVLLLGGLLFVTAVLVFFRYAVQRHHKASRKSRKDVRRLVIGLAVFAVSLGCFILANTPIVGYQLHDPRAGLKPMDVPDTTVYWFFHSIWHFASAIAAYQMVLFIPRR